MFATTILTISMLAMPHELSISKTTETPLEVIEFNGVTVEIDRSTLQNVQENDTVIVQDFPLGSDGTVKLLLKSFEVLTPEAEIVRGTINIDGNLLQRQFPKPNITFLKGAIEGDPSSRVFLAVGEHTTNGLIERDGMTYILAKDKTRGWTTVYNLSEVDPEDMNWVDFYCGVKDASEPIIEKRERALNSVNGVCQAVQVAVDTDYEFTENLFDGNVAASSEYAVTLMAAMSAIYTLDVEVGIQVSFLRLWDNPSDPWNGSTAGEQLPQFREFWQSNMQSVPRHLTHLLSGRLLGGGVAYVGAVCTSYGYAVSGSLNGSFPVPLEDFNSNNWDIFVVAHETGHNCGTRHTHDYSPVIDDCGNGDCSNALGGTIMSYCHTCSGGMTNIVLSFHPRVQRTIEHFLTDEVPCSLDCDDSLVGSCCHSDSTCTEISLADCENLSGTFLGSATVCATSSCNPIIGACCLGADGTCEELSITICVSDGGSYMGTGTECADNWCDVDMEYACCLGESCSEMTAVDCELAEGFWAGFGSFCALGACDPMENDFCDTAMPVSTGVWNFSNYGAFSEDVIYDNEDCPAEFLGGVHSDVWFSYVACEDGVLLVSTCDIINFDSDIIVYQGTCDNMVQVECNGDGEGCGGFTSEVSLNVVENDSYLIRVGSFSSDDYGNGQLLIGGQNCVPDIPCVGDINGDLEVNVVDLLAVVDHWGESSILYDVDDSGVVDSADILLIISNWGNCD
jgi:hypothetical protein